MQIGSVVWEEFYHIHTYTHTYTRNWSQYTRNAQYQTCFAGFDKEKIKNKNRVAQKKRSRQRSVEAVREKEVKLLGV